MCSERYAEDIPFLLPKTQLPPTRSHFSKQSNGIPRSCSAFAAAMPEEPAPITHAEGNEVVPPEAIKPGYKNDGVSGLKFVAGVT